MKTITIEKEPFASFFKQNTVIFLSDIHVSSSGYREHKLIKKINALNPDYILLGGDYVAWDGNYQKVYSFFSKLRAKKKVIGVLGDSDYVNTRKACNFCHDFDHEFHNQTVTFLKNQTINVNEKNKTIRVIGVEPFAHSFVEGETLLYREPQIPKIILSHQQINLDKGSAQNILLLSGDTHGGQFFYPRWLWEILFGEKKGNIRKGMVRNDNHMIVVSSGIGNSRVPIRLFCPPEIIVFSGE